MAHPSVPFTAAATVTHDAAYQAALAAATYDPHAAAPAYAAASLHGRAVVAVATNPQTELAGLLMRVSLAAGRLHAIKSCFNDDTAGLVRIIERNPATLDMIEENIHVMQTGMSYLHELLGRVEAGIRDEFAPLIVDADMRIYDINIQRLQNQRHLALSISRLQNAEKALVAAEAPMDRVEILQGVQELFNQERSRAMDSDNLTVEQSQLLETIRARMLAYVTSCKADGRLPPDVSVDIPQFFKNLAVHEFLVNNMPNLYSKAWTPALEAELMHNMQVLPQPLRDRIIALFAAAKAEVASAGEAATDEDPITRAFMRTVDQALEQLPEHQPEPVDYQEEARRVAEEELYIAREQAQRAAMSNTMMESARQLFGIPVAAHDDALRAQVTAQIAGYSSDVQNRIKGFIWELAGKPDEYGFGDRNLVTDLRRTACAIFITGRLEGENLDEEHLRAFVQQIKASYDAPQAAAAAEDSGEGSDDDTAAASSAAARVVHAAPAAAVSPAKAALISLFENFERDVSANLNMLGESAADRADALQAIFLQNRLTDAQLGRVYFHVYDIANQLFLAGRGPEPKGGDFGRDNSCVDEARLREAIRRAAAEIA